MIFVSIVTDPSQLIRNLSHMLCRHHLQAQTIVALTLKIAN